VRLVSRDRDLRPDQSTRPAAIIPLTPFVQLPLGNLGILPVDVEDRTETHFIKIFFIWFSANTNILSCVCSFPFPSASIMVGRRTQFYLQIFHGGVGPCGFRAWPSRLMPRHYVLHPAFCYPSVILVSVGSSLSPDVLNRGGQVRHGAQNWVCVSCAPHDIHLGAYSTRHTFNPCWL
jgi:hypothetical protein